MNFNFHSLSVWIAPEVVLCQVRVEKEHWRLVYRVIYSRSLGLILSHAKSSQLPPLERVLIRMDGLKRAYKKNE